MVDGCFFSVIIPRDLYHHQTIFLCSKRKSSPSAASLKHLGSILLIFLFFLIGPQEVFRFQVLEQHFSDTSVSFIVNRGGIHEFKSIRTSVEWGKYGYWTARMGTRREA